MFIPNEFEAGNGCHCSDKVLFVLSCACMYKMKVLWQNIIKSEK